MDGWVTIGTKLDTKQLEKDIKDAERMLRQHEKEAEKLTEQKEKVDLKLNEYQKRKQLISDETNERLKAAQAEEQVNFVLEEENAELKKLKSEYQETFDLQGKINGKIQENTKNQELLKGQVQEMNHKLEQTKGFDNIKSSINEIGNSMKNAVKTAAHWAIAIFGVRSAYMFVRNSISTLSQYNDQIAADVQYIRFALASTLQPVIERIIQLAYKLLSYIGYIAKAWFGVNIFANASTKAFEKNNKALGKSVKSAKELNKQLAGFDEMNVLQDNSSAGADTGGGGGGATMPGMDLSGLQGEVPEWLKWIADNKDIIMAALAGIAAGLIAIKLGASLLMGLGIGLIVAGIVMLIQDIIKFIQDPTWGNFANILRDLAIILAGIAIVMIAINAANPVGWIILAIAAVTALVALIIKNWDKIKAVLGKVGAWIKENVIDPVVNFFTGLWDKIVEIFSPVIEFFGNIFSTAFNNVKIMIDNFKQIISAMWQFIKGIISPIVNWLKDYIIKPISNAFNTLINGLKSAFNTVGNVIKSVFNGIVTPIKNVISQISNLIKKLGTTVGNILGGAFKGVVNGILASIENILNGPIRAINGLIGVINKVPGVNLTKLSTFKLPRLAKGGIINMPGRGVPVGGAIAGEAGREAVLPLTDSQQMELLGEAIGRYITINATINNTMNGRVISRELQKINNESDFAFNR